MGKATLVRMLAPEHFLNCDLPSVRRQPADPEPFFEGIRSGERLTLDEVHRLRDPALVLKVGMDEFPAIRLLAAGCLEQ